MSEACMFEILALPERDLKKILPKASARSLAKLVSAYPRTVGKTFLTILSTCLSQPTITFLEEELNLGRAPTYGEIRNAESELMKIIREEHLEACLAAAPRAISLPQ